MKNYVIIGNGAAAIGTVEGIRSRDTVGKITIISKEDYAAYCRPLISYYLEGKTTLEKMHYRPDDFYKLMNCTVLYGKTATAIDEKTNKVVLNDKTELSYDEICIAAGSSPFVPPFKGIEKVKRSFEFMTLNDTLALEKAITPDSRVLIVGAGLIGLKCAEGISERAAEITVCDLSDRVLSSILDNECAQLMQTHLEKQGIRFILGDTVSEFEETKAFMKGGSVVNFDILVLAVGVRPNTELALSCGAECNKGIITNTHMQTNVAHVYSAGDCTEVYDASTGANRVLAILPNAYMQGFTAGVNMSGGNEEFSDAIPMNSIGFFGLHAMSAGSCDGEIFTEKGADFIRKLYVRDDRLVGFMLVGNRLERTGILTNLIREKTPLSTIDFDMLKKISSSTVFSQEERRKKFGGVV